MYLLISDDNSVLLSSRLHSSSTGARPSHQCSSQSPLLIKVITIRLLQKPAGYCMVGLFCDVFLNLLSRVVWSPFSRMHCNKLENNIKEFTEGIISVREEWRHRSFKDECVFQFKHLKMSERDSRERERACYCTSLRVL